MVWGNEKVHGSGGVWVCKGWEVVVVSGLGAHLGLEGPLQGAKRDSRWVISEHNDVRLE